MMTLAPGVVSAQSVVQDTARAYPTKPSESGGGTDVVARALAQGISGPLGQNVVVDNRVFALSGELVARETPDGYTLLGGGTPFWTAPLLQKMRYDVVKDYAPISLLTRAPSVLVVHPPCRPSPSRN
jgi:tripartite-type tricarboxylate transporter receptor subunit TctC